MRVDFYFYCGEEKRKEYTQDAYNQSYVQKWHTNIVVFKFKFKFKVTFISFNKWSIQYE